jgi:hypothetical protein
VTCKSIQIYLIRDCYFTLKAMSTVSAVQPHLWSLCFSHATTRYALNCFPHTHRVARCLAVSTAVVTATRATPLMWRTTLRNPMVATLTSSAVSTCISYTPSRPRAMRYLSCSSTGGQVRLSSSWRLFPCSHLVSVATRHFTWWVHPRMMHACVLN